MQATTTPTSRCSSFTAQSAAWLPRQSVRDYRRRGRTNQTVALALDEQVLSPDEVLPTSPWDRKPDAVLSPSLALQ